MILNTHTTLCSMSRYKNGKVHFALLLSKTPITFLMVVPACYLFCGKGRKVKSSYKPKWPIRPERIPVSAALSD